MPNSRFLAVAIVYAPLLLGVFAGCGEASLQSSGSNEKQPSSTESSGATQIKSTENSQDSAPKIGLRHSTEGEGIVVAADSCAGIGSADAGSGSSSSATGSDNTAVDTKLCKKAAQK